jgi:hypothetical protein
MRNGSYLDQHRTIVSAAMLAAYINNTEDGFRQKDVKTYLQLFLAWAEPCFFDNASTWMLCNSQIARLLGELEQSGHLKRTSNKKMRPKYRLSGEGYSLLVADVISQKDKVQPRLFFFSHFFVVTYAKPLLRAMVSLDVPGLKLEPWLRHPERLVNAQLQKLGEEIAEVEAHSRAYENAARLGSEAFVAGKSVLQVASDIGKAGFHQVQAELPMTDLISEVSGSKARWEIETGSLVRRDLLCAPTLMMLRSYRAALEGLRFVGGERRSDVGSAEGEWADKDIRSCG